MAVITDIFKKEVLGEHMKIAVLSGKGGAGKTFVSVNLAAAAGNARYIDCDVEEPNGNLFFKEKSIETDDVSVLLPEFASEKCDGCRKCVDFCRFNALVYIKKPRVFPEVCHSCGGCKVVCPKDAVTEKKYKIGRIEKGKYTSDRGTVKVVTGILNMGEASGVPVINRLLKDVTDKQELTVIDCPPGSACSVMESVTEADTCILVAEPTAFGLHNFKMIHQLAQILEKPCFVVINKVDTPYKPLEEYCKENNLPIVGQIPYNKEVAQIISDGKILCEEIPQYLDFFQNILKEMEV